MDPGVNITTVEKKAHERITDLYIRAAQIHPENPDADVQSGLGVLLNMSFEFDKAIDCFKAAVSVRPDDAGSWNRFVKRFARLHSGCEESFDVSTEEDRFPGR